MGADLKRMVLALAALKCCTVNKSLEVDDCGISGLYRSVCYRYGSCVVVSFLLQCCVNFLIGNSGVYLGNGNTKVLAKCYFRLNCNFCCKDKWLTLLKLYNINAWAGYDVDTALVNCCRVVLLHQAVGSIFIEDSCAVHLLNHCSRNLALAESRNTDLVLFLLVSSL